MIKKQKKIFPFLLIIMLLTNISFANSRVAFSRPGDMMRIPTYAFAHENPYFFSISVSSEIVNFSSEFGKSSNIAAFKLQTKSGYTFGLTGGNVLGPADEEGDLTYTGEFGFHMQKSIFKHENVSLSAGVQDILYRTGGEGKEIDIDDISFFAVLTSRKSFDKYQLSINVGAGSGKVKYDPHIDDDDGGLGLFLGFTFWFEAT